MIWLLQLKSRTDVTKGKTPDFYHFKIGGMAELVKVYGKKSVQVQDAQALLETFLNKVRRKPRFAILGGNLFPLVWSLF